MRVHDRDLRLTVERRPPGQRLVEHTAERIDIGAPIDSQALELLGRRVIRSTNEEPRLGDAGRCRVLDDAEVADKDAVGRLLDKDVRRLDVPVDELQFVRRVERYSCLLKLQLPAQG